MPLRTCIACRQVKEKRNMIRLIATKDGIIKVDPTHREPGRGAYICMQGACWAKGIGGKYLEHALQVKLSPDNQQALLDYGEELFKV
ncbi:MAG: YlxR family protein [Dehalococcoidia bacterium]|nr:YlxR family protein [Dehalococcoidia bacterium]